MIIMNPRMYEAVKCHGGGGPGKPPPPPAPPVPPAKEQASTYAKKSLGQEHDPRKGRAGTILTPPELQGTDQIRRKTLLGE